MRNETTLLFTYGLPGKQLLGSDYHRSLPSRGVNAGRPLIFFNFTFLAPTAEGAVFFFLLHCRLGNGGLRLTLGARGVSSTLQG